MNNSASDKLPYPTVHRGFLRLHTTTNDVLLVRIDHIDAVQINMMPGDPAEAGCWLHCRGNTFSVLESAEQIVAILLREAVAHV